MFIILNVAAFFLQEMYRYLNGRNAFKFSCWILFLCASCGGVNWASADTGAIGGAFGAVSREGIPAFHNQTDPVAGYETYVPNKTPRLIPFVEYALLKSYLDNNRNIGLIKSLAAYHLRQSLVGNGDISIGRADGGDAVRHTILAQYFLNRALDMVHDDAIKKMADLAEKSVDKLIASRVNNDTPLTNADENHLAHELYQDAFFNNHEEKRYDAAKALFNDFFMHPKNMLTNTYLATVHVWNGGEGAYSDPAILYDFILAGYFSVRTRYLAEQVEALSEQNPNVIKRFRLAGNIGSWTVAPRRWLAEFHGDQVAVDKLDLEHRLWLDLNPQFTSIPIGLLLFNGSPEKVAEGFGAWNLANTTCQQFPLNISCIHWARATYNYLPYFLGEVDYLLRLGQVDQARTLLSYRNIPVDEFSGFFSMWDLGRDAWMHREQNLEHIVELYQNNDPSDDPANALLKRHKWGPSAITCQLCHQSQGKIWPEENVEQTLSKADVFPAIGRGKWPAVMTSWYGSSVR